MSKKSITEKRVAGVLMPVASLPSKDGAGSFGKEAYAFVDCIAEMGMKIWQLLPLNPLGYGNSPYQPFSSFAGDELYIDLGLLEKAGYIKGRKSFEEEYGKADKVEYEKARDYKAPYLREAYKVFWEKESKSKAFLRFAEMDWVYPYAVFIALKKQNDLRCWNEWPKEQQDWILNHRYDISHLEEEIQYQMFLQYMFYKQWNDLKRYANKKGVSIMGDIPFYVGIDSLDVWSCRENFLLGADGQPTFIAGVPPDYFSVTGQRWGNPIYDWDYLKKNQFVFWIDRLAYSSQLYDIIRIDHFRAFDTYWKIPSSCDTAIEGEWVEAPGYELFDTVFEKLPNIQIVAEDLGDLRPQVLTLRDHYHFMGMNIVEFSFLSEEDPTVEHQLIYTGTHDNQTVKGWYADLDEESKRAVRKKLSKLGKPGESVCRRLLRYTYESRAKLAIIPVMDILELDDSARLNTPGTVGSPNWEWSMKSMRGLSARVKTMQQLLKTAKR